MRISVLAASAAALALGLAATAAHAQTAASSVDYGDIHGFFTVTDDGADVLDVTVGRPVTLTGSWSLTDNSGDTFCPACVIQLYLAGLPGLPVQADLFNGFISTFFAFDLDTGNGGAGSYSLTFNAPTTPGTYYIGGASTLDFHYDPVSGSANGAGNVNYQLNVAAAPEPAAWAMMLTGFMGLGAVLRRRRGAAIAA